MSKKAMFVWCVGLGLLDGIYCILCSYLPHIQNYMWIGFISLPIYFCGGAKLEEMPKHFCCAASGIFWGGLTLVVLDIGFISNIHLNMLVFVTIVVCIACFVHLGVLTENVWKGLFSSCPMMFGGFAAIFSQGLAEWFWVLVTLTLGLIFGCIMASISTPITKWIDKN